MKTRWMDVSPADIDKIVYADIPDGNSWRVHLIQEITDVKFGQVDIPGFSIDEYEEMLSFACTT